MLASTKKKVQEGMLIYTNEVIPRSLLDMDSVLGKQAVSCHKCLLGFCGDRKTTYPAAAGHHVLMTGVQSLELRDEIFMQLCKHLTANPESRSTLRGWILMCLCVDLFPPSVKFELYLLNFLGTASADKVYGEYARYSIARLEEALDLDEAALENLVLERGLPSVECASPAGGGFFFFGSLPLPFLLQSFGTSCPDNPTPTGAWLRAVALCGAESLTRPPADSPLSSRTGGPGRIGCRERPYNDTNHKSADARAFESLVTRGASARHRNAAAAGSPPCACLAAWHFSRRALPPHALRV